MPLAQLRGMAAAGIEEAVKGVQYPDAGAHCDWNEPREARVGGAGEKNGPEDGDGWSVEREQMPKLKEGVAARGPDGCGGA